MFQPWQQKEMKGTAGTSTWSGRLPAQPAALPRCTEWAPACAASARLPPRHQTALTRPSWAGHLLLLTSGPAPVAAAVLAAAEKVHWAAGLQRARAVMPAAERLQPWPCRWGRHQAHGERS